ncbi:MAG: hypothetical protein COX49_09480 [bacterium (Candidatus Stahlbacteria) CG23_combo_of_CG06-09_8_20_14_all_40_9]|nr:MAG: hypothetical protein COX49_09480 [bacterium (Candidatus Stahlbacteria) CG23_combo_of_CG06-09_8_20_14_all_40_9]
MASIKISKDIQQGKIVVTFSYDPKFVAIVKSIEGHRWHPDKKYCLPAAQGFGRRGAFPTRKIF